MDWLNYRHLYYFWVVARTGSVAGASRELRLTHPTVSAQLHQLEGALGAPLFRRSGRGLALTDVGHTTYRYASEIFGLGREMVDVVQRGSAPAPRRLVVGVTDFLPKPIVQRLLEPALAVKGLTRLICREDRALPDFLRDLSMHALDLVLSDAPAGIEAPTRLFNHVLGDCGTAIFGSRRAVARLRRGFPQSLTGQPFLLPGAGAALRRSLEHWFDATEVRPRVVAEVDDSSLAQTFAANDHGVFAGPAVMAPDARSLYGLLIVGTIPTLRQRFYAISVQRQLRHSGVVAICQAARNELFS